MAGGVHPSLRAASVPAARLDPQRLGTTDVRPILQETLAALNMALTRRKLIAAALLTEAGNIFTGVVVTDSDAPALSCGACRQVLAEFNPEIKIVASLISGDMQKFNLS